MKKEEIENPIETINGLIKQRKFMDAINLADEKGLQCKNPEIYLKMEKAGAMIPGYAARDCERFGYLSLAIKYNRKEIKSDKKLGIDNQRIKKDLKRLENWVLKNREDINDDNYYIPLLLLEDAEQTGNSIDRNFHKTKKLEFVKCSPFIETLELLRYEQN